MKRDVAALADREFDLLVVGAGVYGAAIAWDGALRGLSVALIDRADFGSGTSFNNLKTVHGGIRYLQHADFRRMRESIRERRNLLRIAPHLVRPLPFLVPTYRGPIAKALKSRPAMRAAVLANDLIGFDRNRGNPRQQHLPAGRSLSAGEVLELAPALEEKDLTGGVLWYDAQMYNSDRLTLSFVLSAAASGAVVANFVEASSLSQEGARVTGVVARDRHAGSDGLRIRARLVINACGPWVDRLTGSKRRLFHFSKALNLVTKPFVDRVALGVVSRRPHCDGDAVLDAGGRFLCLIPWRDVTLVGTSHAAYDGTPDDFEAQEADVQSLIDDVNAAYPRAGLERGDVRLVHRGLLPMAAASSNGSRGPGVTLLKQYQLDDHEAEGLEGLLSVVGVKYTTARDVAEKAVDRALVRLGQPAARSRSRDTPLVGGDFEDFQALVEDVRRETGVARDVAEHLALSYGTLYRRVLEDGSIERVSPESPVLDAEIRHAVREEMALDLASVVLRRTELGTAGRPSEASVEACAAIVQEELGWSPTQRQEAIDSLERFYQTRT